MQLHSCGLSILQQGEVIAALQAARDAGKTRWLASAAEAGMGIIAKRPIANASWLWPTEEQCPAYSELSIERALRFTLPSPKFATLRTRWHEVAQDDWTGQGLDLTEGLFGGGLGHLSQERGEHLGAVHAGERQRGLGLDVAQRNPHIQALTTGLNGDVALL